MQKYAVSEYARWRILLVLVRLLGAGYGARLPMCVSLGDGIRITYEFRYAKQ